MDSEKLMNLSEIKKLGHLIIYGKIFFFGNLITFRHYYYEKYMFLTSLTFKSSEAVASG